VRVFRNRKANGRYYGSYRVILQKGSKKSISLETQDADEAQRRARLAKKGLWSPTGAAATAAAAALDPGRSDEAPPAPPGIAGDRPAGPDRRAAMDGGDPAAGAAQGGGVDDREPLDAAAQAAAAEAAGAKAEYIPPSGGLEDDVKAAMADLGVGGDADLFEQAADGVAAFLLWAEGKAVEAGINWRLKRRGRSERFVNGSSSADGVSRKIVRASVKAQALRWFPKLFETVEPWMGIAVGLAVGAGEQIKGAHFVDKDGNPTTMPPPPPPNGAAASSPA
jgi:hypothetical protein